MEGEDDLLPISALQHLVFCPRQCALIHLDREWAENRLTAEGGLLHARVQKGETTTRGALRVLRALPIVSRRLGWLAMPTSSKSITLKTAESGPSLSSASAAR